MNDLNKYFNEVLGYDVSIVPASNADMNRLPLIIKNKYSVFIGTLFDREIVFIHDKHNLHTKVNELRKHIDIIKAVFNIPVVYVCDSMKGYNRKRFIQKGISFIIPGKQMFMPELLIDVQDFAIGPRIIPKRMTPATQYLLLYHLQIEDLEGMNFKAIAKSLNIGAMTITRAAAYLADKGICNLYGAKEKHMHFGKKRDELWKEVEPLMQNPIKKRVFSSTLINIKNGLFSGINALSHYTEIADDNKPCYAMDKRNFDILVKQNNSLMLDEVDGDVAIEIWKYNPAGLCKSNFVDPLSLYLVFREDTDERVQIMLNQLIDEIKW